MMADGKRTPRSRGEKAKQQEKIMSVVFAVFAAASCIVALVFSAAEVDARADSDAYNASPVCPPSGIAYSKCRMVEAAVVDGQAYVTGSKAKVTKVPLRVSGQSTTYTATLGGQESGSFPNGAPVTITVWGLSVAQVADSTQSRLTEDSPGWNASNDVTAVVFMLVLGALFGRLIVWVNVYPRVAWRRFILADIAVVLLITAVAVLLGVHSMTASAYLAWITVAVLIASAALWPRVAWVQRPGGAFSQSEQPKGAVTL
jgi:hypothetical protein